MTFAIFYNDVDMADVERVLLESDSELAAAYWEGGIKNWRECPLGQSPYEGFIPTNTARVIPCDYGTLAEFADLIEELGLKPLATDMRRECGGVEPWPVV